MDDPVDVVYLAQIEDLRIIVLLIGLFQLDFPRLLETEGLSLRMGAWMHGCMSRLKNWAVEPSMRPNIGSASHP